jgi:hypothetical protein
MRFQFWRKFLCGLIAAVFLLQSVTPAQSQALPAPGEMVGLSSSYQPSVLQGVKVYSADPFRFDFLLDPGDGTLTGDKLKEESSKLIKYFLAALTIPEKDLWVNLSPFEKDRIIPDDFGLTEIDRKSVV